MSVTIKIRGNTHGAGQSHKDFVIMLETLSNSLATRGLTGNYRIKVSSRSIEAREARMFAIRSANDNRPNICFVRVSLRTHDDAYNCFVSVDGKGQIINFENHIRALSLGGKGRIFFSDDFRSISNHASSAVSGSVDSKPSMVFVASVPERVVSRPEAPSSKLKEDEIAGLTGFYADEEKRAFAFHLIYILGIEQGKKPVLVSDIVSKLQMDWGKTYRITSRGIGRSLGILGSRDGFIIRTKPTRAHSVCYYLTPRVLMFLEKTGLISHEDSKAYNRLPVDSIDDQVVELPANPTPQERLDFLQIRSAKYLAAQALATQVKDDRAERDREKNRIVDEIIQKNKLIDEFKLKFRAVRGELKSLQTQLAEIELETSTEDYLVEPVELSDLKKHHEQYEKLVGILSTMG